MNRARNLGQRPSLYQLQSQWDQDRAAAQFAPFLADIRAAARRDLTALPALALLLALAVTGLACIARAFA